MLFCVGTLHLATCANGELLRDEDHPGSCEANQARFLSQSVLGVIQALTRLPPSTINQMPWTPSGLLFLGPYIL